MSKGIVVLSNGFSTQMLENVFSTFNQVRPLVILDGIGAIVDVPVDLVAAIANLPGLATVSLGTITGLDLLPIPLIAKPWLEAHVPVTIGISNSSVTQTFPNKIGENVCHCSQVLTKILSLRRQTPRCKSLST